MPLSAVDLEASEALARQSAAQAAQPKEAPARRKAVMVITDADVGHPSRDRTRPEEEGESAVTATQEPQLRVTGWREDVDLSRNSVQISGTLQNPTANPATTIGLDVLLFDEQGGLLERSSASLERGFLNPGASVRFDAYFQDTLSYDRVEFEIRSRGFMSNPPPDETDTEPESTGGVDSELESEQDL